MRRVALYLRSSKDRHDVSIAVQRRDLTALATSRGWTVAAEFADVVESGKDDDRDGFQALAAAVKQRSRGWDVVLLLDTSRLARNRYIAICFEHDCARHGVEVVYKSIPDTDPLTTMMLKSIMQAWDEYHSLVSRQKGLAGMAANVRAGYRAGGRAPFGYRLKQHATGAIRDGAPVTKTTLELSDDAERLREYLTLRAGGVSRTYAARTCGIDMPSTTLIGIERNALTYAGHTVWNQHAERITKSSGYKGGKKHRPRSEWIVNRSTHPALITDAQAEAILTRLEAGATTRRRADGSGLLVGLLRTPDGRPWWSDGPTAYRVGKGARVSRAELDTAVLGEIAGALKNTKNLAAALIDGARKTAQKATSMQTRVRTEKRLAGIETQISRTMDMAAELRDPAPALRKIDQLEAERRALEKEVGELRNAEAIAKAATTLKPGDVADHLRALASDLETSDTERKREALALVVGSIILDPTTRRCEIHYRIAGSKVASPRGFDLTPLILSASVCITLRRAA